MEKVQAILFDLDGTLWDSSEGVLKSWNQVLEMHPECGRGPITQEELNGCFGLPMTEIAAKLFPGQTTRQNDNILGIIYNQCRK